MKAYGFKYKVDYVVEAESEEEAVIAIADLIKRDWMGYIGEGELTSLGTDEEEMPDSHF